MSNRKRLLVAGALLWSSSVATAQCLQWDEGFGSLGVGDSSAAVVDFTVFDDGNGPALYAGGFFLAAGDTAARYVARWDGTSWSALGAGTDDEVVALVVFDDGGGPALYAGGDFETAGGVSASHVARWDGTSWSPLGAGTDDDVFGLAVFDDGNGPALYAGGRFTVAGGVSANHIARWDGTSWSALGSGMAGGGFTQVGALAVFDDGGGPALHAGGRFDAAGGVSANHVARWDGTSWSALGTGVGGSSPFVDALAVFDDGGGAALYAGGAFTTAGTTTVGHVARWDGTAWSDVAGGFDGSFSYVATLQAFDDGGGSALYAGGDFTSAGGASTSHIARLDGTSWSALGTGTEDVVLALAGFDDGGGPALYVGGFFEAAGGVPASGIARWDGSWSRLDDGQGIGGLARVNVWALGGFADGGGPALYAGGDFDIAGGTSAARVARWNGTGWSALGSGIGTDESERVHAFATFDDGGGADLYVGGRFTTAGGLTANGIARWDGTGWSAVGGGLGGIARALEVFDDGTGEALFVGGSFGTAGGVTVNGIARWDGTSWSDLAGGTGAGVATIVTLETFDDGGGQALYAGGSFTSIGGVAANRVARWDGTAWTALGAGMDGEVWGLVGFDDGDGPALYAGGNFASAGGTAAGNVARWDGTSWSALGAGTDAPAPALAVFDDGGGPALHVGGYFTTVDGVGVNHVARWDGTSWSDLDLGVAGTTNETWVFALLVYDDGHGPGLWVGGAFGTAGDEAAVRIARWSDPCASSTNAPFCFGTDERCPCQNGGDPDSGCDNSQGTGGVRLAASDFSPDGMGGGTGRFVGTGFPSATHPPAVVLRGTGFEPTPVAFGDGLRCVAVPVVRFGATQASQGISFHGIDHGAGAGSFYYQLWYRSNPSAYCDPNAAYNLSNAYKLVW